MKNKKISIFITVIFVLQLLLSTVVMGESMERLTYEDITSQPKDAITTSLALPLVDSLGKPITWSSNNKEAITNSGRVIRPRFDQQAKTVTLTADFGNGEVKDFTFTVIPDEKYTDPLHMTDEEFFGKWNVDKWEIEGKFDYSLPGLDRVKIAVKSGYYNAAKAELLKYLKNRKSNNTVAKSTADNAGWANMVIADVHNLQGAKFYQGEALITSHEYQETTIQVPTENIVKGGSTTYSIMARYNENSEALIASKQNSNKALSPKIELIINGKARIFDVDADATIRAGAYKETNYGTEENLKVKMYGELLGDETYRSLIRFSFSDLTDSDVISSAKLILNAKVNPSYVDDKSLIALLEPTNIWEENAITWKAVPGYVYNFNGIPGGNHWDNIEGADIEYAYQSPRFSEVLPVVNEYIKTKDEKYAYYIIGSMMDFIKDKGMLIDYTKSNPAWPVNTPLRGGYPRTLDSSIRVQNWWQGFEKVLNSPYMTPEACTTILKTLWDTTDNLQLTLTANNAKQTDMFGLLTGALKMPEFTNSKKWVDFAQVELEKFIYAKNFPDGSYSEATGGYNVSVFTKHLTFKQIMQENGRTVSPAFDEMVKKAAYYNTLLRGPNGANLQYGDESAGKAANQRYPQILEWYGDKEFDYVDSFGRKGTRPSWTSKQFTDSGVTLMRSDWVQRALFAFTEVRGGGVHGHFDDNSMTVIAYDRTLLSDAGIFTYTANDPYRVWGTSTRAHNTVEINNKSQIQTTKPGEIRDWITTNNYDFLRQSTNTYADFDHQRTITFVKPNFWIVSDLMTPKDLESTNSYKQSWHMLPTADLTTDGVNKTINSNFQDGANITVVTPDKDIKLTEEDGWYDSNYQQLVPSKFAYYELNNVKGKASYDTILFPYEDKGSIEAQRIDVGVAPTVATAMKFKTVVDEQENMNYYLLDNEHNAANTRTFDKYKTNNKLSFIREDKDGKWKEIILAGGSSLTLADGSLVADMGSSIKDMSFEIKGTSLIITTSQKDAEFSKVVVSTTDKIESVIANGVEVEFVKDADKITLTNTKSAFKERFNDIANHWAKEEINQMSSKGIAKGDEQGRFNADATITRAEMIAMMVRSLNLKEVKYSNQFKDVKSTDWYANVIQTAINNKLISADDNFRPNDNITREEMSKIVIVAAEYLKGKYTVPADFNLTYSDLKNISDWALGYVKAASYYKLMGGMEDGTFVPSGNATRAEVAAVISRILK